MHLQADGDDGDKASSTDLTKAAHVSTPQHSTLIAPETALAEKSDLNQANTKPLVVQPTLYTCVPEPSPRAYAGEHGTGMVRATSTCR